jgi:hypothetical protein
LREATPRFTVPTSALIEQVSGKRSETFPAIVRIYNSPDTPNDCHENAWRCDASWREKLPLITRGHYRKVLRAGITGDTPY